MDDDAVELCFFAWEFDCQRKEDPLTVAGADRICTVIQCSQIYCDGKDTNLQESLNKNNDNTMPALLIGSVVTSILKNQATSLQVGLAVKMGESKKLVNAMYKYGVSCTYSELRRFKKSAAMAAVTDMKLSGISNANDGLVQVIINNFDAEIASQNGKLSTHSLAVIVTQAQVSQSETDPNGQIRRLTKDDISDDVPYDVEIHRYQGQRNPEMPQHATTKSVLSLKALTHQAIVKNRATEMALPSFKMS